jgi:hypothetical protein
MQLVVPGSHVLALGGLTAVAQLQLQQRQWKQQCWWSQQQQQQQQQLRHHMGAARSC